MELIEDKIKQKKQISWFSKTKSNDFNFFFDILNIDIVLFFSMSKKFEKDIINYNIEQMLYINSIRTKTIWKKSLP